MLEEIPLTRPETPLLDSIDSPADLKSLDVAELDSLARELRLFLLLRHQALRVRLMKA